MAMCPEGKLLHDRYVRALKRYGANADQTVLAWLLWQTHLRGDATMDGCPKCNGLKPKKPEVKKMGSRRCLNFKNLASKSVKKTPFYAKPIQISPLPKKSKFKPFYSIIYETLNMIENTSEHPFDAKKHMD